MFSRSTADTVKVRHDPRLQFPMEVHINIILQEQQRMEMVKITDVTKKHVPQKYQLLLPFWCGDECRKHDFPVRQLQKCSHPQQSCILHLIYFIQLFRVCLCLYVKVFCCIQKYSFCTYMYVKYHIARTLNWTLVPVCVCVCVYI